MPTVSANNRIAKNTLMLYLRMLISVCINLYASRVLLHQLGVVDFGVYNVVGGVVALVSFLNTAMAGSSSRFLAYEIENNNLDILKKIFSASMQAHVMIAVIVLLLGETIGLWFVNTQLVIPENLYVAANVVYQFALFTSVVSFIQIPYSADVIAREKMDTYAIIEICNVSLKLLAVFLLKIVLYNDLIVYPIFLFLISIFIFLVYRGYCKNKFLEAVVSTKVDKSILLPMLKFSTWDLYGNGCIVLGQQGTNILMNRFFGVVVNAAIGVANQAGSAVVVFVSNITMALRPPIIKLYAERKIKEMENLIIISVALCLSLAAIICVPLFLKIKPIMILWLSDVPPYASDFCRWMIVANGISVVNPLFVSVIHATGNIKRVSLITGSIYLLSMLFVVIAYYIYNNPVITYVLGVMISIMSILVNLLIIKKQVTGFSLSTVLTSVSKPAICLGLAILCSIWINNYIPDSVPGFFLLFIINAFIVSVLLYLLWIGPKYSWNILSFLRKLYNK